MKIVHKLIESFEEELEGAKEYAEKYIDSKARGNIVRAEKYSEMAKDELKHAGYMKEFAIRDYEEIKKVYPIPTDIEEAFEHALKKSSECMATVKQMLSM